MHGYIHRRVTLFAVEGHRFFLQSCVLTSLHMGWTGGYVGIHSSFYYLVVGLEYAFMNVRPLMVY